LEDNKTTLHSEEEPQFLSGATLGTVVHRAWELLDNGYNLEDAKKEALAILDEEFKNDHYEIAVSELLSKYEQFEELNIGRPVANEWAFNVVVDGVQIIGEIDKIVEKNGEYHLIDLKTNYSNNYDELTNDYSPQLYLYKMAYEKFSGKKVSQLSLFFMREGKEGFRTILIDDKKEEQIRNAIKQMVLLKQQNASKESYENLII
jgi:ATP-dependent helicase/nuclease subunit A